MKKILICVLSIILLISLWGCGSKAKEESTKSEEEIVTKADEEKTTEEDKTADENKIQEPVKSEKADEPKVTEPKVINKKIVVIDPGHSAGGNKGQEKQSPDSNIMKIKDPGGAQGVSTNVPEYVVAMKVAVKLKNLLEQNNIQVIMTKTQDNESPGNIERAEVGNNNNADLAIRIHCDSAESQSAHGASMLTPASVGYAKNISSISRKYGQIILNDLVAGAGMSSRGVVERNDLTGFNWSKVPVVLVEMGFMSNPQEDKLLNDDSYQNKLAEGLGKGILDALKAS